MLTLTRRKTLLVSGLIWLGVGLSLMTVGLNLFVSRATELRFETEATLGIALALMLGWFKGKFVLRKTASKTIERVQGLSEPISLKEAFGMRYLLLILLMMSFGMALRFVDPGIRGFVDIVIGAALIHGSMQYFTYDKASP